MSSSDNQGGTNPHQNSRGGNTNQPQPSLEQLVNNAVYDPKTQTYTVKIAQEAINKYQKQEKEKIKLVEKESKEFRQKQKEEDKKSEQVRLQWEAEQKEKERVRQEEMREWERKQNEWNRQRETKIDKDVESHNIRMQQISQEKAEVETHNRHLIEKAKQEQQELLAQLASIKQGQQVSGARGGWGFGDMSNSK